MIPAFDPVTGYLPAGVHEATWDEVRSRLGFTQRRRVLLDGLRAALAALGRSGCRRIYLDGSFVTSKRNPRDFDACWEVDGVDPALLDPVLLNYSNGRAAQKAKFGGELFMAHLAAVPSGTIYLDFFQRDVDGNPKGIIALDIGGTR